MSVFYIGVLEKKNSSNRGKIFIGDAKLPDLLIYDEESTQDFTDDGLIDVEMLVSTKSFTFGIGFVRLRELFVNYKKTNDKPITTSIENIDAGSNAYLDEANSIRSSGAKTQRIFIDRMTGTGEKYFNKSKMTISGPGLEKLEELKMIGRVVNRGRR